MPGGRPRVPLEEHKDFIIDAIEVLGLTQREIAQELLESHGVYCGRSTLVKTLAKWGVRAHRNSFDDSAVLRERLQHFFHQTIKTDEEIAELLTQEGLDVTGIRVRKLRKQMGLYKRVDAGKREESEATVEELLRIELQDEETKKLSGKQLYRHMRAKYNVVGRDRMFAIAKRLDPEGPERRLKIQRRAARRSGLAKERAAKEGQEREGAREGESGEQQDQHQHRGQQQRPLPAEYLPLDPAMYQNQYPADVRQPGDEHSPQDPRPSQYAGRDGRSAAAATAGAPALSTYPTHQEGPSQMFDLRNVQAYS